MKKIVKCEICGKKVDISKERELQGVDFTKNGFICSDECNKISEEKNFPLEKFPYTLQITERKSGSPLCGSFLDEEKLKKVLKEGLGWKGVK